MVYRQNSVALTSPLYPVIVPLDLHHHHVPLERCAAPGPPTATLASHLRHQTCFCMEYTSKLNTDCCATPSCTIICRLCMLFSSQLADILEFDVFRLKHSYKTHRGSRGRSPEGCVLTTCPRFTVKHVSGACLPVWHTRPANVFCRCNQRYTRRRDITVPPCPSPYLLLPPTAVETRTKRYHPLYSPPFPRS